MIQTEATALMMLKGSAEHSAAKDVKLSHSENIVKIGKGKFFKVIVK